MIHFNELYITEDGKNLVIDAAIDGFDVYKDCYITDISVQVKTDCGSTDPYVMTFPDSADYPIDAFLQNVVVIVDLDGDGKITYKDEELCIWVVNVVSKLGVDSKYDVNLDGVVDPKDVYDLIDYLTNKIPKLQTMDVNSDNTINIADVEDLINAILQALTGLYTSDEIALIRRYFNLIISGEGQTQYRYKRVRKCIPVKQLLLTAGVKESGDNLFLVKVNASIGGNAGSIEGLGCGWDIKTIYGLAYNDKKLYDTAVNLASSYGDDCDNNDAGRFMDFILRYYAFIFAIKCGNIDQACQYWNNYLRNTNAKTMPAGRGCGCHGAYR
jgi:hypothetical protein